MSEQPRPVARSIIVCEEVVSDPAAPRRLNLERVITVIHPKAGHKYPVLQPQLAVFAQLTECRGTGRLRLEIRSEETDAVVYQSPDQTVRVPNEPLVIHGVVFRVRNLAFLRTGIYWVQLRFDDDVIAQTPITLRPQTRRQPPGIP